MNIWLWAAAGMFIALVPLLIVCFRGEVGDRLVGLEMTSCVVTLEMVLLIEGFRRPSFYDLPLTLALLGFGGGMVFARFVQRWL
jgi:multicomponent Na+:H+ antiporter subunit F